MQNDTERILLAHGSGGKLTHRLIGELFLPRFANPHLAPLADSALLDLWGKKLAFTTDSFVVTPIFFPGGDIGRLAVYGTANDLAVMGARTLYLSCAFVIEEGLELHVLETVLDSMKEASEEIGATIVTGDTKVVEKGNADRLFINTSGIGIIEDTFPTGSIVPGDLILLSGTLADHGIAVLAAREDLMLEAEIHTDCAPLQDMLIGVLRGSTGVKFMRDPTRGGLATVLNELVEGKEFGILIHEQDLPVREEVQAICDLLGFDPLYVANEGKAVLVAAADEAKHVLHLLRGHRLGREARIIGEVADSPSGRVILKTRVGGTRILDMLPGDQLPRIC